MDKIKKCPFCGYEGKMKISNKLDSRMRLGIKHTIVTIQCGGICTASVKQAGKCLEDALKNCINVWNKRCH